LRAAAGQFCGGPADRDQAVLSARGPALDSADRRRVGYNSASPPVRRDEDASRNVVGRVLIEPSAV